MMMSFASVFWQTPIIFSVDDDPHVLKALRRDLRAEFRNDYRIVNAAGATFLSLINYLIPVWAVTVGAVLLGEHLPVRAFLAMGLILAGVLVTQRHRARHQAANA